MLDPLMYLVDALVGAIASDASVIGTGAIVEWPATPTENLSDDSLILPLIWVCEHAEEFSNHAGIPYEILKIILVVQQRYNQKTSLESQIRELNALTAYIARLVKDMELDVSSGNLATCFQVERNSARNLIANRDQKLYYAEIITHWKYIV